jgi:hypothetical protein
MPTTSMRAVEGVRIIVTVLKGIMEREVYHGLTLDILLTPGTAIRWPAEGHSVLFLFIQQQALSSTQMPMNKSATHVRSVA